MALSSPLPFSSLPTFLPLSPSLLSSLFHRDSSYGQLAVCDFCPLVFHLDCLSPPLTCPPSNAWMCPMHPDRKTVRNLLPRRCLFGHVHTVCYMICSADTVLSYC